MFDAIAGALRPAQHGPVGWPRSLLAAPRDSLPRVFRARNPARRLHRHRRCRDRGAPRRAGRQVGGGRRFRRRHAAARRSTRCARAELGARVRFVRGDAMRLPVLAACLMARRLRSVSATCRTLRRRVRNCYACCEPGGRLAILEFGLPVRTGCAAAISLVFPSRLAAHRPRRLATLGRVLVSARVGWCVSVG